MTKPFVRPETVFQIVDLVARCCVKFRIVFGTVDLVAQTNRTLPILSVVVSPHCQDAYVFFQTVVDR